MSDQTDQPVEPAVPADGVAAEPVTDSVPAAPAEPAESSEATKTAHVIGVGIDHEVELPATATYHELFEELDIAGKSVEALVNGVVVDDLTAAVPAGAEVYVSGKIQGGRI